MSSESACAGDTRALGPGRSSSSSSSNIGSKRMRKHPLKSWKSDAGIAFNNDGNYCSECLGALSTIIETLKPLIKKSRSQECWFLVTNSFRYSTVWNDNEEWFQMFSLDSPVSYVPQCLSRHIWWLQHPMCTAAQRTQPVGSSKVNNSQSSLSNLNSNQWLGIGESDAILA